MTRLFRHLYILSTVSKAAAFVKNSSLFFKSDTGTYFLIFRLKKSQLKNAPETKKKRNNGSARQGRGLMKQYLLLFESVQASLSLPVETTL